MDDPLEQEGTLDRRGLVEQEPARAAAVQRDRREAAPEGRRPHVGKAAGRRPLHLLKTQRKIVLKHFVKGFVFKKNIKSGPIKTLGGKYIYLARNADTHKVKIFSQSEQSNIKVSDIKTEFGLVHLIDTVLTGNTARFFVKGLDF